KSYGGSRPDLTAGRHVATGWTVGLPSDVRSFPAGLQYVTAVFHPHEPYFAVACNDGPDQPYRILLWDTRADAAVGSFRARGVVNGLAFSPDGRSLAVAGRDKRGVDQVDAPAWVQVWDVDRLELVWTILDFPKPFDI